MLLLFYVLGLGLGLALGHVWGVWSADVDPVTARCQQICATLNDGVVPLAAPPAVRWVGSGHGRTKPPGIIFGTHSLGTGRWAKSNASDVTNISQGR